MPAPTVASAAPAPTVAGAAEPESGSQTTEYALVIVVAATIAALALTWARQGGISSLFNAVLKQVRGMFGIG
jgi:hypothetical protein